MKHIAYIFEGMTGFHINQDGMDYLDERGNAYPTRMAAMREAWLNGYTHARGTYWKGVRQLENVVGLDADVWRRIHKDENQRLNDAD